MHYCVWAVLFIATNMTALQKASLFVQPMCDEAKETTHDEHPLKRRKAIRFCETIKEIPESPAERRVATITALLQAYKDKQYDRVAESAVDLSYNDLTMREGARNLFIAAKDLLTFGALPSSEQCLLVLAAHPGADAEIRDLARIFMMHIAKGYESKKDWNSLRRCQENIMLLLD